MKKNKDGFAFPAYGSGNRAGADGSKVKEKRFRYSCHYNVRHPSQCDGQSGYGIIKTDEPRTLDFSGVRGFLVTNVCIVQRSAA